MTIGLPLVFGPPSGRRHTFIRYTRPRFEKNSTGLCVEVTNNGLLNAVAISGGGTGQVLLGESDSGNAHLLVNH